MAAGSVADGHAPGGGGGFQAAAARQQPLDCGGGDAGTRVPARPASQRRLQLVASCLGVVLATVVVAHFGGGGWRGGLTAAAAAGRWAGSGPGPAVLDEAAEAEQQARVQAEDEAACAEFDGFLKEDCMEKRSKERNAPKYWNADELRNGLWKTEKALADLEIRQYKHGKERDALHKEHEQKLDKFKQRMEVALTLIHQIQDEMGTRHSQLVERLKADIVSTQTRLKKYLDDGVEHVNGKVAILEEREAALTERLLEMVEAQYQMLKEQAEEVHAKETAKDQNVHAFIAGVEAAQQAGDLRIEEAINATRAKFDELKAREAEHYANLTSRKDQQVAKQAQDVVTATTKIDTDVAALRANLTATLTADKADIRSNLHAGWTEANASLAQLALDAEAAAAAIDSRLAVQTAAQAANNAEQDELIGTLESDLHVFNLTVFDEIIKVEGNATRFENALALAENTIRGEQEAQKSEILAHINAAIAEVEEVHKTDKAKMEADVAYMKPKAAKVAQELQEAIAAIEAQRQQDLAFLTGKLASNISDVNATYQQQHAAEKTKAEAAVQALASALSTRRDAIEREDELRSKALGDRMTAYKASSDSNNADQGARLAALRANFTAEAARRVAELLSLDQRAEAVRASMEAARTRLLDEHHVDMAQANATLSTTLDKLITDITDLLEQEVTTTDGSIDGDMHTQTRALARLDKRIKEEDMRLNMTERQLRAEFEHSKNVTETRIETDVERIRADRARWNANTALAAQLHGWLDSNITAEFQRLDDERRVILASLNWDLSAGLASVTARVEKELEAITGRQRARLSKDKLEVVELLGTLANLQEQLDANATAQVEQLHEQQVLRDAAHSRVVASLESEMGQDKERVQKEIDEFNVTYQEAAQRNEHAQAVVKETIGKDERKVRSGFGESLAHMRAALNRMIAASNVTELEDLSENVREVMMKASKLSWRLGAKGADLRALLEKVTEEQQNLFNVEGERLQQIKEAEVRAYHAHTQELTVLQSRVANEENELTAETNKLHEDLLGWDSSARDAVPPAVEAMELRLDTTLRGQGSGFKGALQTKVASQLARAQQQRTDEQATLAQLASDLEAAKGVLDGHVLEQTSLVANANVTVTNTTAYIVTILDAVEPILAALQTRLATVYDSIRAQHAVAQAKVNADVRKGIADLGEEGIGEVSKEKLLLEALVAENMADPEKDLTMLQARLNGLDTEFRNALSAEKELSGNLHSDVRVRLGRMEREVRESNSNLTSYMNGLQEDLDDWKTESTRALSKLEAKQGADKNSFLQSLRSTQSDVRTALRKLRRKFNAALTDLNGKITQVTTTLKGTHQQLKDTLARDKVLVRRDVKGGINALQSSTLSKLHTKGKTEKENIQTIINAKTVLVRELTASTNKLIAGLRNRVRLATAKEASDNQGQEQQLNTNQAQMNKWIRNSQAGQSGLEARLERLEERVKRRQERSQSDQTILVAQLASKLQRQVAWLNSSFASSNSGMVSTVQGTLGQRMAGLERKLGAVRAKTLRRLARQKLVLESLDKSQKKDIAQLQLQLAEVEARLKRVGEYSRGRTSRLVQDAQDAEANLRVRLDRMMTSRKDQTERIKASTDRTYQQLQDDWTRRIETQRQWLSSSVQRQAQGIENRLKRLSRQLENQITRLDNRLTSLSNRNDNSQDWLKRRVAQETDRRGAVEVLEHEVARRLDDAKSGVVAFKADMAQLESNTKTEVEELERKIDENQGISTSTAELLRTIKALKRDVKDVSTQERQRDRDLRGRTSTAKREADATQTYLESQVRRLERMLTHDSNIRRRNRSSSEAKAGAYQMRMDRYRADLTRINATWNALDAGAAPADTSAFDAPPAPPSEVVRGGKSVLNAWCARFRDRAQGYNVNKQLEVLSKCYTQDCQQSLEGGNVNRPDRPGCRFLDENGFCFAHGAAQMWCRDHSRRSRAFLLLRSWGGRCVRHRVGRFEEKSSCNGSVRGCVCAYACVC